MILLLDIGNTRAKYVVLEQGIRSTVKAIDNNVMNHSLLEQRFTQITKVVVASVASENITDIVKSWCEQKELSYQRVYSEKQKNGVKSAYHLPEQLGIDRWLTLVASRILLPKSNVLIVDAGTATTIDVLSDSGQHIGGWILAGVDTLFESVLANTTKVAATNTNQASLSFGCNTSDNVNNACWAATAGTIYSALKQAERQNCKINKILLTGGNAKALQPLLTVDSLIVDDLVFQGLQAYSGEERK